MVVHNLGIDLRGSEMDIEHVRLRIPFGGTCIPALVYEYEDLHGPADVPVPVSLHFESEQEKLHFGHGFEVLGIKLHFEIDHAVGLEC